MQVGSVFALTLVINGGGFDLGAGEEEAGVGVGGGDGCGGEGKHVDRVAVNAHEASVVEEDGGEPEGGGTSGDRGGTVHVDDLALVVGVEGEGVLFLL